MSQPHVQVRPLSGYFIVATAYVVATLVAALVLGLTPAHWDWWWRIGVADLAATFVVFAFSVGFDNSSVYDPYWSVAPPIIAGYLALGPGASRGLDARQLLTVGLLAAYGARLTYNWLAGWAGLSHEDWRYVEFRQKTGKAYWLVSFFGLHFFPTVMVWLGCLPLYAALVGPASPLNALDVLGGLVLTAGVVIEAVADEQLRAFRRSKPTDGAICDRGLWRYSRHPNYFGELLVWVGVLGLGLGAAAPAWTGLGVAAMFALFLFASIPMAERRSLARRTGYAEHQRRVSLLVPWFRKA